HLRAWGSVRDDVEKIGVTLADRIDPPRQVRTAPTFCADSMTRRAIDTKRAASGFDGAGIVFEGILRRSLGRGESRKKGRKKPKGFHAKQDTVLGVAESNRASRHPSAVVTRF